MNQAAFRSAPAKAILVASASFGAMIVASGSARADNLCAAGSATFDPTTFVSQTDLSCQGPVDTPPTLSIPNAAAPIVGSDMLAGQDEGTAGVINIGTAGATNGPVINLVAADERITAGGGGIGQINLTGGSQITGNYIVIGYYGAGQGTINVSGANTRMDLAIAADIGLLDDTQGVLNVTDGGAVAVNGQIWAGHYGNGQATITVSGAGSALTSTSDLTLGGENGDSLNTKGFLTVANGGRVTATRVHIGSFGQGTATVTGANSLLQSTDDFGIGENVVDGRHSQGTLILANGGIARAGDGGQGTISVGQAGVGQIVIGSLAEPTATAAGGVQAGQISLGDSGSLIFSHNQADSSPFQFGTAVAGTGSIQSQAGTTMLTGNLDGFTGQTIVSGGNLVLATNFAGPVQIASGGTFTLSDAGTFTGSLANAGTFAIDTSQTKTLDAGGFSGTGAIGKAGSGTLTLTGVNAATGGVRVNAGVLTGTSTAIGTGPIAVNGGALAVTDGLNVQPTATVDGVGSSLTAPTVSVTGPGVLALSNGGTVSVGGGAGTLQVGGNGGGTVILGGLQTPAAAGIIDAAGVSLASDGTLALNNANTAADPYDLVVPITGAGTISSRAGATRLGGDLSGFTGSTLVAGGNLILATGLSGPVNVSAGAVFTLTDQANFTGQLTNAGSLGIDTTGNKTLDTSGFIGTAGVQKFGTGTLTLTGANGGSGGLGVNGGTVVADFTALGSGPIAVNGGGSTLAINAPADGTLVSTLSGNGVVAKNGAGYLSYTGDGSGFTGALQINDGAVILGGFGSTPSGSALNASTVSLGADAALAINNTNTAANPYLLNATLTGTGTLVSLGGATRLSGDTSGFTGSTEVDGGNLILATSLLGPVTVSQGAVFTLTDQANFTGALTNAGSVGIDTSSAKTLDTSGFTATAGVQKFGTGTLTLTGTNGGNGGVVVNGGTIVAVYPALGSGSVAVNGTGSTLAIEGETDGALASAFSGNGVIAKNGAGILAYTGDGSAFTGVLQVNAGSVALGGTGAPSAGGVINASAIAIAASGTLTFNNTNTAAAPYALTTVLTGGGTIQSLAGATRLAGDASGFTGQTRVTGGDLILATTLGGPVQVSSGAIVTLLDQGNLTGTLTSAGTLAVDSALDATVGTGGFTGAADVRKSGTGTLTLTGINAASGGVAINGGTVTAAYGALGSGPVAVNGAGSTLALDGSTDGTLASTLSGNGAIAKNGGGALAYAGNGSAFTGSLQVNGGALRLTGTLSGGVTLANGTSLSGNGRLATLNVLAGATVAPGSASKLTVTGNATFAAGSTYLVGINATPGSDLLSIGGSATLGGATVGVVKLSPAYAGGTQYTILTAAGGVNGTFAGSIQQTAPFLNLSLGYDANNVYLRIARALDFTTVGVTANQCAVAGAINALGAGNPIYDRILVSADVASARAAFDNLSGEIHASARTAAIEDSRQVRDAIAARLADPQSGGLWAQGLYNWGRSEPFNGSARLNRNTAGGMIGFDKAKDDGSLRLGVVGGYTDTDLTVAARASSGHVRTIHAAVYAGAKAGPLMLGIGAGYGHIRFDLDRRVSLADLSQNERSRYSGTLLHGFGDVSLPIPLGGGIAAPFANLAYVHTSNKAFAESGGSAALRGESRGKGVAISRIGLRATTPTTSPVFFRADAGWQHTFGTIDPATRLAFTGGLANYAVTGASLSRNSGVLSLDAVANVSTGVQLSAGYNGSLGKQGYDNAVKARIIFTF